jgi:hypothetical protein
MGLGAVSNTVQYRITQYANDDAITLEGIGWSFATGAIGGRIGGKIKKPSTTLDTSGRWIDPKVARSLNDKAYAAINTGKGSFARNLGGAITANIEPVGRSSQECGCL